MSRALITALPATPRQLDAVRRRCRALVKRRALVSAGAVLVPVPGIDIAADVALLTELIPAINFEFGLTPAQIERLSPRTKVLVYKSIVAFGGIMVGRVVSRDLVLKALGTVGMRITTKTASRFVPIAGQALAASISFGAMRLVGESHIRDCERVVAALIDETHGAPEEPIGSADARRAADSHAKPVNAARRLRSAAAKAAARLRRTPRT